MTSNTIDLSAYAPEDLEMKFGAWTIISPVPNARTGKIIRATLEATRRAAWIMEDTTMSEEELNEAMGESLNIEGIAKDEDISSLVLGQDQMDRLLEEGCPPIYIQQAGQFAYLRWALDSVPAAMAWIEGQADANNPKRGNRAQRRAAAKKKPR